MRADRLLSLLMLLQGRGRMTAAELAKELEVSERTIYRDVTALGTSGVPVTTEPGPGGGISLMEQYRSDLTGLTSDEVQALFMLSIPSPMMDLGLDQRLQGAMRKLSAALPATLKRHEESIRQRIHIDGDSWDKAGATVPHLLSLQQAVWGDNLLEIEYRSFLGDRIGPLTAKIAPYGLVAKAGSWFLIAFRIDHIDVLQVERILTANVNERRFDRPADFDLVSFWRAWWKENQDRRPRYDVIVRVSADLRPYLSNVFGESVEIKKADEGEEDESGWSTWKLVFSSFDEARGRILALGRAVQVVEPLSLRRSVIDYAQQIAEMYTGS